MTIRRLLLVDDDKLIHTVLRAALSKQGYQIHSAFDSVQAIMATRQIKPDVIILDITMPGGGGFETFRRLQTLSTTSQIPILVYSSVAPEEIALRIGTSPSVAHLPKPSSPDKILAAVQGLLGDA